MQFLTLDVIFGDRDQDARVRTPILAADREALDQLVVEAELNFVLVIDPVDGAAEEVPPQAQPEGVFAVQRKDVAHREAPVGTERKVLTHPYRLCFPLRRPVHLHRRLDGGVANGQTADLGRGRDVAVHQRRRDGQHVRVVVEADAGIVGRQQRGVDIERHEVANGVDVFQPVQPVHGNPARVGRRRGRAVER